MPDTKTLKELIDAARNHVMTAEEEAAQRASWLRGFEPCEHGKIDYEQCRECRKEANNA